MLYPWHEELSYEFRTLEMAIIQLDKTLETLDPEVKDMVLSRMTDKYAHGEASKTAGPRVSNWLPNVLSPAEREEINAKNP